MSENRVQNMDLLREKADITYEEAAELLTRYDDDVACALIELEKRGRAKSARRPASGFTAQRQARHHHQHHHQHDEECGHHWEKAKSSSSGLIAKGFSYRVIVARDQQILANLPLIYVLIAMLPGFHLVIFTLLCILFSGSHLYVRRFPKVVNTEDLSNIAQKAADNVRQSVRDTASECHIMEDEDTVPGQV